MSRYIVKLSDAEARQFLNWADGIEPITWPEGAAVALADAIRANPPRIPEPEGDWAVVEAGFDPRFEQTSRYFVRQHKDVWWPLTGDGPAWAWRDLVNPKLVREGESA